jgi:hypothetical protein
VYLLSIVQQKDLTFNGESCELPQKYIPRDETGLSGFSFAKSPDPKYETVQKLPMFEDPFLNKESVQIGG